MTVPDSDMRNSSLEADRPFADEGARHRPFVTAAPAKVADDGRLPAFVRPVLVGVVYYLLVKLSMSLFAAYPANIALLWLPAGFAIYAYSRWGRGALAAIFASGMVASFSSMATDNLWQQLFHTVVSAGADTLFALLAGSALNRLLDGDVREPSQLFDFILYCCFIPLTISTVLIATNLWLGGYMPADAAILTGVAVFIGDFLGILLVYPLCSAWQRRGEENVGTSGVWLVASLSALAFVVASFYVAHWLLYLVLPALIFAVIGAGSLYAYASLSASVFLYNLMSAGFREFNVASAAWLEVLALSCSVTIAVLAASLQQRSLLRERNLRERWRMTANHDALTGLANRAYVRLLAQHEIIRLNRNPGTFCMAMLDIDHFKQINDHYGHSAGDTVLVELADYLRNAFRKSDVVSRYGGEEFLILLLHARCGDAHQLIERVRQEIAAHPFRVGDEAITLTFSAGLVEYQPQELDTFTKLIDAADQRLYEAKRQGRNRVVGDGD